MSEGKELNTDQTPLYQPFQRPVDVVGSNRFESSVRPTLDTDEYTAGDAVGGILVFEGVCNPGDDGGVVTQFEIIDLAAQSLELDLVLFKRKFQSTADDATFDPNDLDLVESWLTTINVPAANYADYNDNSTAVVEVFRAFKLPANQTRLYGQLVTRGTPTYGANDLIVKLRGLKG